MKKSLTFGRVIIDKTHTFFGKPDPIAFVVVDCWANEGDDDEVCIDHYRGRQHISYEQLRDTNKYVITDEFINPKSGFTVIEQLNDIVKQYETT